VRLLTLHSFSGQLSATDSPFGWWIAVYFALAALSSGLILSAVVTCAFSKEPQLLRRASWSAVLLAFLGCLCLIADLAAPQEFLLTLTHFNPESWIAWGSRILGLFLILLLTASVTLPRQGWDWGASCMAFLLGVTALCLATYPAFVLLQASVSRPLWASNLLPLLFLLSAIHLGISAAGSLLGTRPRKSFFNLVILLELGVWGLFAASKWSLLFVTPASWLLLTIYLVGSFALPLMTRSTTKENSGKSWMLSGLAFFGAISMRLWLLEAGQSSQSFLS